MLSEKTEFMKFSLNSIPKAPSCELIFSADMTPKRQLSTSHSKRHLNTITKSAQHTKTGRRDQQQNLYTSNSSEPLKSTQDECWSMLQKTQVSSCS